MEIDIADDLLTVLLLYSIPDSYESFRIAIESRDELPVPEMLKIKLLYNYRTEYCLICILFYFQEQENQRRKGVSWHPPLIPLAHAHNNQALCCVMFFPE
ncbi:hypothetical protein X975_10792, partial [Stegodyphus mimosarum]